MRRAGAEAEQGKLVYRRVADLHIACISQGFLATLGPQFLALMYEAIDQGPESVLLVSREGPDVVGFVAGTACGMTSIYRRMLRRWPALMTALVPTFLSPRRLWRIFEIVRYSRGAARPTGLPAAELLAVGVAEDARGKGHAAALYLRLCDYFRNQHVPAFVIVVGPSLEPAHRFYRRMGACPASRIEVHSGEVSTVYLHTLT